MAKLTIIGGGLAGLSAGVYALKAGFEVTILEKNPVTGGLCTTWEKDGVAIDGCVHWVTGCNKSNMMPIYKDLGVFEKCKIIHLPNFYRWYYGTEIIEISRSLSQFNDNLLKYAADDSDKAHIKQFIKMVKKMRYMPVHSGKPMDLMNTAEMAHYVKEVLPYASVWMKINKISLHDYAKEYHSEILKHFFLSFYPSYYSISYFVCVIAAFVTGNADTVNVSSADFSRQVRTKYESLGGKLVLNEEVTKLNFENDMLVSLETKKGNIYKTEYVISACPLPFFYKKLLPFEYHDPRVDFVFNNAASYPMISAIYVSFRLDPLYTKEIDHFSLIYDKDGISCGTSHNETLHFRSYPYLPNKDGSTTIICLIDLHANDYDIWMEAKMNGNYEDLKMEYAKKALDIYVKQFPDRRDYLRIVDVSTPISFEKHTNTFKGTYLSNLATPFGERKTFGYKSDKVSNLYYASQYIDVIGGMPLAMASGKFAVEELVYYYKKEMDVKIKAEKKVLKQLRKEKALKAKEKEAE